MNKRTNALSAPFFGTLAAMYAGGIAASACVPPPVNMTGWWPGDGNADDIADGNPGALEGGATFAVGIVGSAFSLDGVSAYVAVPETGSQLDGYSQLTIDAWIEPIVVTGQQY